MGLNKLFKKNMKVKSLILSLFLNEINAIQFTSLTQQNFESLAEESRLSDALKELSSKIPETAVMENKLTKMMKLAPNVTDSLEKINYITSIPEQSAPIVTAAAAAAAAPKETGVLKKAIDRSVQKIKLAAAKNFAAGQEAAVNAGDVSQISNRIAVKAKVCTDNQDEQLDDCVAAGAEADEDQEEQEAMEAFDMTEGSKDYGSAASNFAANVSQKSALASESDPALAAAVAAPAAEGKQAEKAVKKQAV